MAEEAGGGLQVIAAAKEQDQADGGGGGAEEGDDTAAANDDHEEALAQAREWEAQQQEEERSAGAVKDDVAPPPPSDDRMKLTDDEWELAMDLKAAVAKDPEIQPISDFLYGQFAIFALARDMHAEPPTLESLVDQVRQLQGVRETHGIADNYKEACQKVAWMVRNLPGYVLSYANYSGDESCCVVVDLARIDRGIFSNGEKFSTWLAGVYYMQHACTLDFVTIRKGLNFMVECDGYEWRGQELARWSEMGAAYPLVFASFKHYHTGMFINLTVAIARRLLPAYIHGRFEVGCKFDGRLSDVLLVPNESIATARILENLKEGLKRRYDNVASFSLEDDW